MAEQNAVSWFEIPVTDMDRAVRFYERVLGVALERKEMGPSRMAWFPAARGAAGAAGALLQEDGAVPSKDGAVVYFEVPDIDATLSRVAANGGATLLPKTGIGPFGFVAQFVDSEGNRAALHSAG